MTLSSICLWWVFSPSRSHLPQNIFLFDHWAPVIRPGLLYTPWRPACIVISLLSAWCLPDPAGKKKKKISAFGAKEQEVWRRMVFRWVPVSIIQITTLWWQLWNWTACWMTPGRIGVIGLCRYMHKSHSACLCPLRVISLTHAIKDHLYGQITNLNPSPCLETPARPSRSKNHSSYFNRLTRSTICCNAEAWGAEGFLLSRQTWSRLSPSGCQRSVEGTGVDRWPLHCDSLLSPAGFSGVWNT